ncbi:endolysin [Escherichia phage RudolfGeigy]|uniref:Lysin n=1 Tax=Escherichia phage nom TaxID=2696434 RepID=A0A6B9XH23_9CAUD|nr:glycoside hydrolase family 104 protein [Escherichia coli]QHR75645.1 lysin [Escherichia phage nom]QXV84285.1 endolysin [Escherichia phage RudolfGeigy]VUF54268.1 Phage lysin [Escherichia phage rV5_ev147]VVA46167.1 Phage lysin [Escherichia phage rV5_ev156]
MKLDKNVQRKAFLDMIAYSEGTDNGRQPTKDRGYDVIVGGKLFSDYSKHPGVYVKLNAKLTSSAAGRYQVLEKFAKHYMKQLGLPDFGPDSQDKIALQLIRECKALADIDEGRIHQAIYKCRSRWASFPPPPGAGKLYNQRAESIDKMLEIFKKAGGVVTDE